jgi:PHD/YefM family antitoxin component YafN of YafNO toxin-antitoxin module
MNTRTIPLSDREPRLSDLADRANEFLERFILTREGEARAVLLAAQDYDGLLETLEILSDSELVQRLVRAEVVAAVRLSSQASKDFEKLARSDLQRVI